MELWEDLELGKSEKDIRRKLTSTMKKHGWLPYAIESPLTPGFPDNIYIREGVVLFMEVKLMPKSGKPKYRKAQLPTIQAMRRHGALVFVATEYNGKLCLLLPQDRYTEAELINGVGFFVWRTK